MDSSIFKILQIVISILLVGAILIQAKGKGLSSGVGNVFSMYRARRGVERFVFVFTIVLSIFLIGNSLILLILSR